MEHCKVIVSGVAIQQKQRLDDLVSGVAAISHSEIGRNINNSLLLRLAIDDFLEKYGHAPVKLANRLKIDAGEE